MWVKRSDWRRMEALTVVSVAALRSTICVKWLIRMISDVRLVKKTGGKSGTEFT